MNAFEKWFDTFVAEKNIPYASWEIEANGTTHFIDNDVVMEHIRLTKGHEAAGIKDILVKIDFHNGDVNHFFKHLATGLANNY